MTIEEALKIVEIDRMMFSEYESVEHDIAYGFVMEALKKQMPKKPFKYAFSKNWYCPNCEGFLLWGDAEPNINDSCCGRCGQRIDWSDLDDE